MHAGGASAAPSTAYYLSRAPRCLTQWLHRLAPDAGVSGPSILGVTPAAGVELAESRATANGVTTSTILVRGNLATGVIGTLSVRGVNVDRPYTTQIREAAARASGNYVQRADLSQYRVTVQK